MTDEEVVNFLEGCRLYLQRVERTFRVNDQIEELLNHITNEIIHLHMEREEQEITVFRLGYEEGYRAALREIEQQKERVQTG
jgi:flagellar biosynthesis/type III secretory pathway protein FliH